MKTSLLLLSFWTFLCSPLLALDPETSSLRDGSTMTLHGLGLYQDLNTDVYIGALYLPPQASGIAAGQSKKMEMRIVIDDISGRQFTRQWLDSITLNSSREERAQHAGELQTFSEIYSHNLVKGDHVSFEYSATFRKTVFLLNGTVLAELDGEALYNILLNCWVGKTPLSAQFKAGIMNQLDTSLIETYQGTYAGLMFSEARRSETAAFSESWKMQQEQQAAAAAEQQRQQEEMAAVAAAAAARKIELARLEAERLVREQEAAERAAREKEESERLAQEQAQQQEQEQKRIAAEQEELRQAHFTTLSKWINQHAIYPERAQQKNLEGKVKLAITTDRDGNIINMAIDTSSGIEELDEAVQKMVMARANPLPAIPEGIIGDSFDFNMPMSFTLPR